ncbi:E3 ubiquitin-protein ligase FANCL-like [Neolamprologus brichardi]|uniref:E3 ubiquitin-protein ligase FANCL-like n=1 Tax=Neolamprologus brichardi TaxID=32507 RepID=UPI0016437DFA|nr:E3 ubiquitin-protein ligase FANCL-like [Neolamprologus brichardi]
MACALCVSIFRLLFIDTEFRMLRLKAEDSAGRQHILTVKLKSKHPAETPECSADLPVPLAINWTAQSFNLECGICYSYRLEAAIPDQVCNDPRCGQPFHQTCLYEWLRALHSSRQSFNIVFGECPYCSKPITVKMAAQKS